MHLHENNIARNALFLLTALLLVSCGAKATATQKPVDQPAQPFTSTIFNSKNTTPAGVSWRERVVRVMSLTPAMVSKLAMA